MICPLTHHSLCSPDHLFSRASLLTSSFSAHLLKVTCHLYLNTKLLLAQCWKSADEEITAVSSLQRPNPPLEAKQAVRQPWDCIVSSLPPLGLFPRASLGCAPVAHMRYILRGGFMPAVDFTIKHNGASGLLCQLALTYLHKEF